MLPVSHFGGERGNGRDNAAMPLTQAASRAVSTALSSNAVVLANQEAPVTDAGRAGGTPRSASLFHSLLVNRVDIRTPELHVRTFALHRHVTDGHLVQVRHPRCCRAILYLSGWGQQMFSNDCTEVEPGVLVMLPPGQGDSFRPNFRRSATCLVLDFQLKQGQMPIERICAINRDELAQTREQIGYLLRMQSNGGEAFDGEGAAAVLQMTVRLLRAAGWLKPLPPAARPNPASAMHRMLLTMDLESPLRQVANRSGYQRDHLNRLVKKETGLTLGQFRAQRRLAAAKEMLARGLKIGDVACGVGLLDPSYFARWFRRQTGQSPSDWLRRGTEQPPVTFARPFEQDVWAGVAD